MYFEALLLGEYIFRIIILTRYIDTFIIIKYPFLSADIPCSEVYFVWY